MYDSDTVWVGYLIVAIVHGLIWGAVCKYIISGKGYNEEKQSSYFWVGFFLGIIGVIIAAVTSQNTYYSANVSLGSSAQRNDVWRCNYCGKTNFGTASYSKCGCGHTRKESEEYNGATVQSATRSSPGQARRNNWKCSFCGNTNYVVSPMAKCSCGKTKRESDENKTNARKAPDQTPNNTDMLDDLEALKKLKELLDMGAITQEEFDSKKAKLLK